MQQGGFGFSYSEGEDNVIWWWMACVNASDKKQLSLIQGFWCE